MENNIHDLYRNLNYFDQYGSSLLLFILISLVLFVTVSYCFTMINIQPIIDDWPNQRCKPHIIPFAGYVSQHDGISNADYTFQNFTYCTQNILSGMMGSMLEPLTYVVQNMSSTTDGVKTEINDIRAMFDKVRVFFQTMTEELMGRIINVTIPLQQMVISFRDLIAKIQGTMTAGLFTLLGSYYTLKSLMGAIAQFIVTILIALAALIAVLWIFPFTWGVAAANTAIFIAIAIPMALILAFMLDVLKVKTTLSIPSIKCFDEDTSILMADGTHKKVSQLKPCDLLSGKEPVTVTAIIKIATTGSKIYNLDGILVSDSHIVKYASIWVPVSLHPRATLVTDYKKPYLYCINTSNKIIKIGDHIFTDWDEIYENTLTMVKKNVLQNVSKNEDIHRYLDGGFTSDTLILLANKDKREISNVIIGDVLANGETVYGVVEIDGTEIKQYKYEYLGTSFQGGANLGISGNKIKTTLEFNKHYTDNPKGVEKSSLLYHLLTNTNTFFVGNIQFCDYNGCIDNLVKFNS